MMTKHMDIGCGSNPRNLYNCDQLYGIDIIEEVSLNSKIVPSDIHAYYGRQVVKGRENFHYIQGNAVLNPSPFDDNSFDSISAYDFIEHIPKLVSDNKNNIRFPVIHFMNEAYRVLKPNGVFMH